MSGGREENRTQKKATRELSNENTLNILPTHKSFDVAVPPESQKIQLTTTQESQGKQEEDFGDVANISNKEEDTLTSPLREDNQFQLHTLDQQASHQQQMKSKYDEVMGRYMSEVPTFKEEPPLSKYVSDPTTNIYDIPKFEEMMEEFLQQPVLKINTRRLIQKDIDTFWDQSEGLVSSTSIDEGKLTQEEALPTRNAPKMEDFVMGKKLGKGMFGQVFVAIHKVSGFICALKIVNKEVLRVQNVEEQFIQELKLHSSLSHPNIIQIYSYFSDKDNFYVLQELCTGGQLFDLLIKRRRISEKRTAYYVKQLVQGLRYIHSLDITHRDIKPENILLESGVVKICDFGWAVRSVDNQHKGKCGTPLYLSPEVVQNQPYCQLVDVWGVGLIAYQLMVGNVPWNIWTEEDTQKIVNDQLTFPEYLNIGEETRDFVSRCLEKDPGRRITVLETFTHGFLIGVNPMEYQDEGFESYGEVTP